jgi:hypothetical protein
MLTADRDAYVRAATGAKLTGKPFETLVNACRRQSAEVDAAKIVSFADMRRKLRPDITRRFDECRTRSQRRATAASGAATMRTG